VDSGVVDQLCDAAVDQLGRGVQYV